ncbi:MAG TPA: WavE lipopolysaccharide synthesis family protein [Ramlibacter sp.]|jgi:hypothetical protein|nr:WavE lipopolysaccharide synthesis family protein [Ramlibacter sp.]
MDFKTSDISFVFQGGVPMDLRATLADAIAGVRQLAPGCSIVVSTDDASNAQGLGADEVVVGPLLPALPGNKRNGLPNNINRQIQSTRLGLAAVRTPWAVKLRTDCGLRNLGFLDAFRRLAGSTEDRIVVCSRFTVDPEIFEQMPYHLSDWFHFGRTETLRTLWACPPMTMADALHYQSHPYAPHSNFFDRNFVARYAVEQHLIIPYARELGYAVPDFHNDLALQVMQDFRRFLAQRVIVLEPQQIGLRFDKYEWAFTSDFQDLNCIGHLDWQGIRKQVDPAFAASASGGDMARRRARKLLARRVFRIAQPFGPLLYNRRLRTIVNRMLRLLK